jgi:hypothetical protein
MVFWVTGLGGRNLACAFAPSLPLLVARASPWRDGGRDRAARHMRIGAAWCPEQRQPVLARFLIANCWGCPLSTTSGWLAELFGWRTIFSPFPGFTSSRPACCGSGTESIRRRCRRPGARGDRAAFRRLAGLRGFLVGSSGGGDHGRHAPERAARLRAFTRTATAVWGSAASGRLVPVFAGGGCSSRRSRGRTGAAPEAKGSAKDCSHWEPASGSATTAALAAACIAVGA